MKTRTYKGLLIVLILLQVGSIAAGAVSLQRPPDDEAAALLKLTHDLVGFHVIIGDYQLDVASGNKVDNVPYEQVRSTIDADLNELEKINAKNPDRLEIIQRQHDIMHVTDQVVEVLRDTANQRAGGERFAILITMLKGTRKLDKLAHQMHEDIGHLIDTVPKREDTSAPALIAAIVCSAVSLAISAVLFWKGSSAMSY